MNCPFCGIAENEPSRVLEENEVATSLLSNPRLVKGHSLVVPKRHVEYPGDLTKEELLSIFELIESTRKRLLQTDLASGVDVKQHYRPFIPQGDIKVDHVHFHVMPRHNEDDLYKNYMYREFELFNKVEPAEIEEVRKLLKLLNMLSKSFSYWSDAYNEQN
jgi:histidine triad (HIT) family protein